MVAILRSRGGMSHTAVFTLFSDVFVEVPVTVADRVYVSLGTAGTYPGYGPVYRNVPW